MTDISHEPPSRAARLRADHLDPRDAAQRLADRDGVRRQAVGLGRAPWQDAYRRVLLTAVQGRRADQSGHQAFQLFTPERGQQVGVCHGELLVRSDAARDAALLEALKPYGFNPPTPLAGLKGRVLQLDGCDPHLSVDQLTDIARFIRMTGHQASVNHITPLGPVMKGLAGPENTTVSLPAPTVGTGSSVRVAVIDTGVTAEQRTDGWLAGLARKDNLDPLDDLPTPNGFLDFGAGHGTFVAGIVQQICPQAEVVVYRAVDSDGVGSEADVACAMVQAVEQGARILNLSLGVNTVDDQPLLAIEVALDLIAEIDPEVLVFAAAGNDGTTVPCWPAASKRVVAVGALAADLSAAPWSNRGFWVDCSTVGEGIVSTYVEGVESSELDPCPDSFGADAWAVWSGTSFAAPQVAGAVARIAGEDGCTPREALRRLQEGCRMLPDYGRAIPLLAGT
ncbi:MAG: S8 family serine peptidase [Actinomycetota bacterium]|nr:S8 family serine peptidase [Actinomycetota bacterium]